MNEDEELRETPAEETETAEEPKPERKEAEQASETKGKKIARIILLLLGNASLIAGIWQAILFNGVSVAAMVFQLMVPMEGADGGNFKSLFLAMLIGLPLLTLLELWFGNWWRKKTKKPLFLWKRKVLTAGIFFALVAVVILARMKVFSYLWLLMHPSTLYEEQYVAVDFGKITAPEQKRNLIYIYMESMETTYADRESGGNADRNRIPYMTKLATEEGECFSANGKLNGLEPVEGAVWTCGSFVSQTTGTPLIIPIGRNGMGKKDYRQFLPGTVSIQEVLSNFGYQLVYLQGSKIEFAGMDVFLNTHGGSEIRDYHYYNKNHRLPEDDYYVWWGFEDFRLYEFAKEEILRVAAEDRPFAVTFMTIDTHFTGGYECPLCRHDYENSYDNAIACADRQLESFLTWLKAQDFYENTTVVIVGDHPTMDSLYYRELSKGRGSYDRKAYVAILNSAVPYTLNRARNYSAVDMFPTTLAAMGFQIAGNRLGLGANLYSEEPTMVEQYGLKKLNKELLKHSKYYKKHLIKGN